MSLSETTVANLESHFNAQAFLRDWSLEITSKDADRLDELNGLMPRGSEVSITFLPNENFKDRVRAAALVRRSGFVPVPHLPARRFASVAELEDVLARLAGEAASDRAFVIAGDARAHGPFEDALALIRTGMLGRYGVRHVGIAGYPEGHALIPLDRLRQALTEKKRLIEQFGHDVSITTQFGFDADGILAWLRTLRESGVQCPVRVGLAGPASMRVLLMFAARCGVATSASVMSRYGLSLSRLVGPATPDKLVDDIASGLDLHVHGDVKLHLYPFGGLSATASWARSRLSLR